MYYMFASLLCFKTNVKLLFSLEIKFFKDYYTYWAGKLKKFQRMFYQISLEQKNIQVILLSLQFKLPKGNFDLEEFALISKVLKLA